MADAFRLSARPSMGMRTEVTPSPRQASLRPVASAPMTTATPARRSAASYSTVPSVRAATMPMPCPRRNVTASAVVETARGRLKTVPRLARMTLAFQTSTTGSATMMPSAPAPSAERRMAPRLPGFSMPSMTTTSGSLREAQPSDVRGRLRDDGHDAIVALAVRQSRQQLGSRLDELGAVPTEAGQERPGVVAADTVGGHPDLQRQGTGIEGTADLARTVHEQPTALPSLLRVTERQRGPVPRVVPAADDRSLGHRSAGPRGFLDGCPELPGQLGRPVGAEHTEGRDVEPGHGRAGMGCRVLRLAGIDLLARALPGPLAIAVDVDVMRLRPRRAAEP